MGRDSRTKAEPRVRRGECLARSLEVRIRRAIELAVILHFFCNDMHIFVYKYYVS